MSDTAIEWTDKTWNPVTGCSKVSPGCAHCYAETVADRFWAKQYPKVEMRGVDGMRFSRVRDFTDVLTHADRLEQPLRWKKPARIFVNSMSDLFHEDVPPEFIADVFAMMRHAHWHTFQVLTKRADRMQKLLSDPAIDVPAPWPLPNVWLGVSVENQRFADERIPLLLQTPAAVRFISAEPLLGDVDLVHVREYFDVLRTSDPNGHHLDWVIVGGESGSQARPCNLSWVRNIVHDCQNAKVPVFVKQLGANPITAQTCGDCDPCAVGERCYQQYDIKLGLKDRKGGDPSEWESYLRVREFPTHIAVGSPLR